MHSDQVSSDFLKRIQNLSPKRLALLAVELERRLAMRENEAAEPIAIIGMACRTPGGAETTEEFWTILESGRDAIEDVPLSRWDADAFYDPRPDTPGKAITRAGGFTSNVDQFDATFFGISPREAPGMDPQHRMLLEVAWEALENAGERADKLEESTTGVFIGISTGEYEQMMVQSDDSVLNAYSGSGVAGSMAAGRLSHFLGLRGPSLVVDTACSASGVAIHLACQSLRSRECTRALAGGVNALLTPMGLIIPSQAHMLAPDGRCKTFSKLADGFVRAEGCGVLVLKRVADAMSGGDRILGLIRGSAINHDGRSSSLTAPNGPAQESAIRAALTQARLSPGDIDHIEAHGTGTVLGDAIELGALGNVFGRDRDPERPLLLSSVKTNVGHLEAAAGVTGVIKTLLALQHEMLPPHLHLAAGNENEALQGMPFQVPTSLKQWPRSQRPRIGGISSFGFSGTNSHLIIEEPPISEPVESAPALPAELITISAKTPEALAASCRRYTRFLRENPETALSDFAWTANGCRTGFQHRIAFTARSVEDATRQLEEVSSGNLQASPLYRFAASYQSAPIAFLFTGQGSQYAGMGRAFYECNSAFRSAIDRCDRALEGKRKYLLSKVIFGDPAVPQGIIDDTEWTQPALFAFEYATAMMWQSWGVHPSIVIGHSLGEYVAACVAGILTLDEALLLAAERGRLMGELPRNGSMMAVRASEKATMEVLGSLPPLVSLAAVNGPEIIVLSGQKDQIDEVAVRLVKAGIRTQPLTVSHAFHSPMMDPMLDAFEAQAATMDYKQPQIEFVSNVTGGLLAPGQPTDAPYWRRHVRGTVRFQQGMNALLARNPGLLIEIGPNPVLLGMAKAGRPEMTIPCVPTLRRGKDEWSCAFEALQQVYLGGVPIDWEGVYRERFVRKLALPSYPFQRQRYWSESVPRAATKALSGPRDTPAESIDAELYRVDWETADQPFVTGGHPVRSVLLVGEASEVTETKMALRVAGIGMHEPIDPTPRFNGHPLEVPRNGREGIRSCLQGSERPDAIVLLLRDYSNAEDVPVATLQTASTVLALLQEVVDTPASSPDIWLVTRGAFLCNQMDRLDLAASAVGAMAKVARLEHSQLRIFQADLPIESTATNFAQLANLLRHGMKEHTVALRAEGISVPRLVRFNRPGSQKRVHIQSRGGYLVTGAFGGLGLRTAQWLVEAGARELYLAGRREPSADVLAQINMFEAAGVTVHLVVADISKEQGIAELSTRISRASSPLRGILHAAGVVDDGILMHQNPERLATVFAPKVSGGWLLHKFSLQHSLDFFVMFGSAAALLGLSGQSNYVAANAFLDSLAEMRHQQGLPATSVAWGAWSDIGMATRVKVTQRSNVIGIGNIKPDRGMQLLEEAIASGQPTLAALAFDWKLFFASRTAHHDWPLLEKLAGEMQRGGAAAQSATLGSLVGLASPGERLRVIKEYLKARILKVLMLPSDHTLREDQPFAELGLDSLMALELKNELQISAGAALPPTFLLEYRNLGLAAMYLDAVMVGAPASEATQAEGSGFEEIVL